MVDDRISTTRLMAQPSASLEVKKSRNPDKSGRYPDILIIRAKAYLAHPPANFPEGVGLIREFVATSGECGCSDPSANQCSRQNYGEPIEQRDGSCPCPCHDFLLQASEGCGSSNPVDDGAVERAWEIVRAKLCDPGDGEEHGDDHHDGGCETCVAIWEIDARLERRAALEAAEPHP